MELVSNGIRVNCIAPGFIKTPMADKVDGMMDTSYNDRLNALHPMGMGEAEDVAKGILFLLSDMSSWMTGAVLNVDGGFTAQ
jgi:NAD(P)-dependent dehydrogenase (short-subunit alcohol dehydrogenase family)